MGCSKHVLFQVMLFQFLGPGQAQFGYTPNLYSDSKSFLLKPSNEVLFVVEFTSEVEKRKQKVLVKT